VRIVPVLGTVKVSENKAIGISAITSVIFGEKLPFIRLFLP
jgi:hypothetical protein